MEARQASIANQTREERLRMQLYVETQHDGGNPSQFLELLSEAVETEVWTTLTNGNGQPLTFFDFIQKPYPDGIGLTIEDLETIVKLKHKYEQKDYRKAEQMKAMRRKVRDLLTPISRHQGRPDKQLDLFIKPYNVRFNNESVKSEYGNADNYTIRRLKRDRPDLAEMVLDGELSANAAAIEAGFRIKSITIPIHPERAARSISNHFSPEQVSELVDRLTNGNR